MVEEIDDQREEERAPRERAWSVGTKSTKESKPQPDSSPTMRRM